VSGVTFIYVVHVDHNTLADHGLGLDPTGVPGPDIDVCRIDCGCSRIFVSTSQGGVIDVF
jgi:hypothetical protein